MASNETFRGTIIAEMPATHVAIVADFGYQDQSGGNVHLDMGIAAGDFQTLVQGDWRAAMRDDVTIRTYRFACEASTHGHAGEVGFIENVNLDGAISQTAADLPNEICISIKRRTGFTGPRNRGRVFFGPVSHTYRNGLNGVVITDALLNALGALLTSNLSTQTVDLKPVILGANGVTTGHVCNTYSIALEFTHRKSRRTKLYN